MSKKSVWIVAALMALSVVVGMLITTDFRQVPFGLAGPDVKLGAAAPPVAPSNEVTALNDAFVAVSKAVTDQVVSITVTTTSRPASDRQDDDDQFDPFGFFQFKMPQQQPMRGSGSGVIITSDGYILTNNHVVEAAADGAGGIQVDLHDGREFDAKLVGRDELTDLAVIKIDATDLPVAAFGNSDDVKVGQLVVAVGNPLGLNSTVTQGIISALGRGQLNLNTDREGYGVEDFIQTDAAINPGNSGGGLFDLRGALVGINAAIASRTGYYQGYGFAIPINLAHSVAEDLIEDGQINRGYIGVRIEGIGPSMRKSLNLGDRDGVLIQESIAGSAGANAGLKQGDVILEVDGVPVHTPNHLQSLIAQKRAGQSVKLKIFRDGNELTRSVTLQPRESSESELSSATTERRDREESTDNDKSMSFSSLGMEVRPLDSQARKRAGVDNGVEVSSVEIYGEANTQGINRGDVIVSANRKSITSVSDLKGIIDGTRKGDAVLLQVKGRSGSTRLVALEVK